MVHVRVGAANAGHTVIVHGQKHVLQQLPVAAYANPWAALVLGAGAMISREILEAELKANLKWRVAYGYPQLKLYVDYRAHVITPTHKKIEAASKLAQRIGSTSTIAGEGIGPAQAARVMREGYLTVEQEREWFAQTGCEVADTVDMLHDALLFGQDILLEGTQGTGLSNTTGQYPYVTSRNTSAAGLAADCGIGPLLLNNIIMVCRTNPIRVSGNSGPFWPDSRELSWQDLGIDPQREKTTVTKKIRRVATFSYDQVKQAARVNSATEIALTFADYLAPHVHGKAGYISAEDFDQIDFVAPLVATIEAKAFTPVTMVGTGPDTVLEREPALASIEKRKDPA
jgi:adenylosuccinate synthase